MSAEKSACEIFSWRDQVIADRRLPLLAFHVAVIISRYVDPVTGDVRVSPAEVAAQLKVTGHAVRKVADELQARGHLRPVRCRGRITPSLYRLGVQPVTKRTWGARAPLHGSADIEVRQVPACVAGAVDFAPIIAAVLCEHPPAHGSLQSLIRWSRQTWPGCSQEEAERAVAIAAEIDRAEIKAWSL